MTESSTTEKRAPQYTKVFERVREQSQSNLICFKERKQQTILKTTLVELAVNSSSDASNRLLPKNSPSFSLAV